jgi:hypothetical protein
MTKRGKRMWISLGIIFIILGGAILFFHIPYSPTRKEFSQLEKQLIQAAGVSAGVADKAVFTEQDIADLPQPLQRYFRHCGYIGTPKMSYMKAIFNQTDFRMDRNKPSGHIGYSQLNTVKEPHRIALIESYMFGIPFQGLDSYLNGQGAMKGVIAKAATLFNQKGAEMDKACLVTFLAESLMFPNAALQSYVKWEEIDSLHAKATISYWDTTASGIFTFDEDGKMLSFTTEDRSVTESDGTMTQLSWSAFMKDYKNRNGLLQPDTLQAVWHYPEGDFLYFDGKDIDIRFY